MRIGTKFDQTSVAIQAPKWWSSCENTLQEPLWLARRGDSKEEEKEEEEEEEVTQRRVVMP